ncbi:hypothetical protein EVAR_20366_1 [Eumeta japonica]|uniref:Uncharacterized protein n=1 Tax=Eumeta variegata TaxID=151549 RepID=A0A4C1VR29_EUMVA|nr:hypothetical protein EVAR_20366_1 [Eumeta japonica]
MHFLQIRKRVQGGVWGADELKTATLYRWRTSGRTSPVAGGRAASRGATARVRDAVSGRQGGGGGRRSGGPDGPSRGIDQPRTTDSERRRYSNALELRQGLSSCAESCKHYLDERQHLTVIRSYIF